MHDHFRYFFSIDILIYIYFILYLGIEQHLFYSIAIFKTIEFHYNWNRRIDHEKTSKLVQQNRYGFAKMD